jgi:hypothetical protein
VVRIFPNHDKSMQMINESKLPAFNAPYPVESQESIDAHWKSISVSK